MASQLTNKNDNSLDDADVLPGEFEVASLVDICYGDIDETGKRGLKFKVPQRKIHVLSVCSIVTVSM